MEKRPPLVLLTNTKGILNEKADTKREEDGAAGEIVHRCGLAAAAARRLLLRAVCVSQCAVMSLTEVTDAKMPPFEVVVELVLSFVISLVGVLITAGEVLPIRSNKALHSRSLPNVVSVPEFHVFNHRGKALHKRIVS